MTKQEIDRYNKRLVWAGAWLVTYAPGDGVKRYRLIDALSYVASQDATLIDLEDGAVPPPDYFGGRAIMTALGAREARVMVEAFLEGFENAKKLL